MKDLVRHALTLGEGNLLRVMDGQGLLVSVAHGVVWITQEGDAQDIVLDAGDSFRLVRDGLTLVHALQPSRLTLSAPRDRDRSEPAAVFALVPALEAV
jgi:hypothetical protein